MGRRPPFRLSVYSCIARRPGGYCLFSEAFRLRTFHTPKRFRITLGCIAPYTAVSYCTAVHITHTAALADAVLLAS